MKDKSVTDIVHWLEENLHQSLLTVDHWEPDMCAIGIARPDDQSELVYISTWNRSPNRFFVELETSPSAGSDLPYKIVAQYKDIDRDALLRVVREHLKF
jgi:hypothetical protein